jgi:hypothetical protein
MDKGLQLFGGALATGEALWLWGKAYACEMHKMEHQ